MGTRPATWIRSLAVSVAAGLGLILATNHGISLAPEDDPDPSRVGVTEAGRPPARAQRALRSDLSAGFARWEARQPNRISVALAPVGGDDMIRLGAPEIDPTAWSTVKVPLAVAATAENAGLKDQARLAIVESNNNAALALRRGMGADGPQQVEAVLARLGDNTTEFEPGEFGRTQWTLEREAVVAANLPCDAGSAYTYALMGQVIADHSWGLGRVSGAHFKGGWGPRDGGGFLVRQLGVMPTRTGRTGVAVTVVVGDGGYEEGTAAVDATVAWLLRYLDSLPSGRCR